MTDIPRCPRCNGKCVPAGALFRCTKCGGLNDGDTDEGGTYSDVNPGARLEREERQKEFQRARFQRRKTW